MKPSGDISAFINAPDTVDFIVRSSDYLLHQLGESEDVLVTKELSGGYTICYTKEENLPKIQKLLGTGFISAISILLGVLDRPSLEASGITQIQIQPYLELTGRGVLLGFVDTGIDYTLPIFRYEDGTSKIRSIYDQTVAGTPPQGHYIGTEYTYEQINKALAAPNPAEIVPQKDIDGHGTFLASVAAGRSLGDFTSAAPDAELIVVKAKTARPYYIKRYAIPKDQQNAFESSAVMDGVEYILEQAEALKRPVVICIGLGTNLGSHDGFSILEEYFSGISSFKGVCICTAAGNECQARHHTQGTIATQGGYSNIDIKVGEDGGDVYLSVWNNASDRMSVAVRSPTGEVFGRVAARSGVVLEQKLVLEPSTISLEFHFPVEGSSGQLTIVKILSATPGIWTVTMYGDIILGGVYNAWLPLTGFVSPEIEFLSANPYTTVTVPSTMFGGINCGAYDHTNNSLYAQSSWGPTRIQFQAPDIISPGVDVGGYYPTGQGVMSGTSVAAAITAGACALMLQWGVVMGNDVAMSTYQIKAYLIRGCNRNEAMIYPNSQWGYGTLNLMQTFQLMREIT